jgi:hypothetical protein
MLRESNVGSDSDEFPIIDTADNPAKVSAAVALNLRHETVTLQRLRRVH